MANTTTNPVSIGTTIAVESIIYIRKQQQQQQQQQPACFDVYGLEEVDAAAHSESAESQQSHFRLVHEQLTNVPQAWLDNFLVAAELPPHLRSERDDRQVHVVVSTKSGTGRAADFERSVLHKLFHELGLQDIVTSEADDGSLAGTGDTSYYRIENTSGPHSIGAFAKSLDRSKEQTIVILSGDGGVIELLNAIDTKDTTTEDKTHDPLVAVLPLGTGNALFNSLHKKTVSGDGAVSPLVQGLRTLVRGKDAPLPCFRADFSPGSTVFQGSDRGVAVTKLYGAIVASYGFHSQLVWESDTDEYRKHGDKRFQMVAGELLKEAHGYRATVELIQKTAGGNNSADSGAHEVVKRIDRDRHAYILATMVSNLERTFTISPHSRPLGDVLRLVHFGVGTGPAQGQRIMDVMMKAYDGGKHIGMRWTDEDEKEYSVGYEEVPAALKITTHEPDERWRKVCVDGTIVEIPEGGSMTVARDTAGRLRILVDPKALEGMGE